MLDVPYIAQIYENACGAAALEMVYRYLKPSAPVVSFQKDVYNQYREVEPMGTGNYRIKTDDIVKAAQDLGLYAGWGRVSRNKDSRVKQLRFFVEDMKLPIIACQSVKENDLLGHFRVILEIDHKWGVLHDPSHEGNGRCLRWRHEKITRLWARTGDNVTGGVAIWIADRMLESPLGPDHPNEWT